MSLRSDLLEAYKRARQEDLHGDLQRDLRGLIKRNYAQKDVNSLILNIDSEVTGKTAQIAAAQSSQQRLDVDALFNKSHKKKMEKAGKRISSEKLVVAVETIPEKVILPETEIKSEAIAGEMLNNQYRQRLAMDDKELIATFGSLAALRNYGNGALGLDLNKNSRTAATVAAVKEALAAKLGSNKDEEE